MKFSSPLILRVLTVCAAVFAGAAHALPGDLDTTFAPGGSASPYAPAGVKRFVQGAGPQSFMSASTVMADGRIVVAGWCGSNPPPNTDFCVSRLSSAGTIDSSFAGGGTATVGFSVGGNTPSSVTLDAQENIWVGGYCAGVGCIFKFSPSGGRFVNVGVNGQIAVTGMADVHSLATTSDNKIVVGGRCYGAGSITYPCVARLLTNGTIDPAFNGGAIRRWGDDPFAGGLLQSGAVPRVWVSSDGRIYAANRCDDGTSLAAPNMRMCLAIVEANGTLPPIYFPDNSVGYFYYTFFPGSTAQYLYDMVVQTDGSAVVAGLCHTASGNTGCMTRIIPGVGIDQTFGSNGVVTSVVGFARSYAHGVVLREDGSLILVHNCTSSTTNFNHNGICLAAYTSSGAASNQFGSGAGTSSRLLDLEAHGSTSLATGWFGASPGAMRGPGNTLYAYGACQAAGGAFSSCIARISLAPTSGKRCSADIDGNGTVNATSDGLLLVRSLLGLSGSAVTAGAVAPGAPRSTWSTVRDYLALQCDLTVAP